MRSATNVFEQINYNRFVSIHALLAECDFCEDMGLPKYDVSIHALLAECDPSTAAARSSMWVSIHALLAECDPPKQ